MNFKELSSEWQRNKKLYVKLSSISAYWLLVNNHLIPSFGKATEISEQDLQDFVLLKLDANLSQKTVRDILIVLKMVLKYGVKQKLWGEVPPFDEVKFPTNHSKNQIQTLTAADYKKAVTYVKANFSFRNFGVLLTLSTGMRIGEVCALKWNDFDLHEGTVTISRTIQRIYVLGEDVSVSRKTTLLLDNPKTKSSNRTIPLSADLLKILKPLDKILNQSFFVLTNDEKPTEPRTYRSYYKELMVKIGLPAINFHGLRHSFATQCIAAKVDVKTVSVLLGHSNISTTFNLYVHPNKEQKKSAIDQLFKSIR